MEPFKQAHLKALERISPADAARISAHVRVLFLEYLKVNQEFLPPRFHIMLEDLSTLFDVLDILATDNTHEPLE